MLNSGQQEFFFLVQIRDSFSKDFDFDLYDLSVTQEHFKLVSTVNVAFTTHLIWPLTFKIAFR